MMVLLIIVVVALLIPPCVEFCISRYMCSSFHWLWVVQAWEWTFVAAIVAGAVLLL